jgi:hypothetical protein
MLKSNRNSELGVEDVGSSAEMMDHWYDIDGPEDEIWSRLGVHVGGVRSGVFWLIKFS